MLRCIVVYTIIVLAFVSSGVYSQPLQLQFENYSTNEGLCSNEVLGTFKDSRGFLWIRTDNGLSRYDGIAFENFTRHAKDSNSLAGNNIYAITELPGDLIFIGTTNGLCIFNDAKHCFENWRVTDKTIRTGTNSVVSGLIVDPKKNLWVNHDGRLDVYDSLFRFKFCYTDLPQGKILKGIVFSQGFSFVGDSVLWLQNINHGLAKINLKTWQATCHQNSKNEVYHDYPIRAVYYDRQSQQLYYSPWGMGLYCYNIKKDSISIFHFPLKNTFDQTELNTINSIVPFRNNIMCASENGLIVFDKISHQYKIYFGNNNNAFDLPSSGLNHLLLEPDSLLWISTSSGLSKCNLREKKFRYFGNEFKSNETDANVLINHFGIYKSEWIIVGTIDNGIFTYNIKTQKQQHYFNKQAKNAYDNLFSKIYVDRHNIVWVSTYFGLRIYNPEKNIVSLPPKGLKNSSESNSITMFNDSKDDYWMSYECDTALVHATKSVGDSYQIKNYRNAEDSFPLFKINRIKEDSNHNIWIASSWSLGFLKWNRNTNLFERFPKVKSPSEYLSDTYFDIFPETDTSIWLASHADHGLLKYNSINNTMQSYTTDDGLISNNPLAIYKHTDNTFWIFTDEGISHFNPVTRQFKNYGADDGLPETEFGRKVVYDSVSKNIYASTAHYIIYFNPDEIEKQVKQYSSPLMYMKQVEVNGTKRYVDFSKPIILKYNENNINFEYSGIDFLQGNKTTFAYNLDGLDDKWTIAGNRRFVNFTNLSPGTYHFKLKLSSGNELWSEENTIATIIISKPFYLAWWFVILVVGAVAMAVYIVYDYRRRNIKAMRDVRERISRDLHDDIGSTLNSISIYSEIAKLKGTEETQREKFLETIGNSSRNMIEQMNDIVWTVNPMNDKFENILMRMRSFASEITEGNKVQLQFDIDESCKSISLEMNQRKNFYLIFKEALSNAMKYSEATEAMVMVKLKENFLMLVVSDNGIGFETSPLVPFQKRGELGGNGLRNMKARAEEIKGELKIESDNEIGTSVELKIKV